MQGAYPNGAVIKRVGGGGVGGWGVSGIAWTILTRGAVADLLSSFSRPPGGSEAAYFLPTSAEEWRRDMIP